MFLGRGDIVSVPDGRQLRAGAAQWMGGHQMAAAGERSRDIGPLTASALTIGPETIAHEEDLLSMVDHGMKMQEPRLRNAGCTADTLLGSR